MAAITPTVTMTRAWFLRRRPQKSVRPSMLGFEVSPIVQYVVAFAIIAILLALFAIVLKRIGGNRFAMSGGERGRGRQPRLGIVDVYDLDRQRQLVLLRRDNVEHLVMLGGANDFVVESNIVRMPASRAMAPQAHMQPGQAPHGAAPVAGPEAGHDRAPIPEVGYAPQPVAPGAPPIPPIAPQPPASQPAAPQQGYPEQGYPEQGYPGQASPQAAPEIPPARAAPQPPQPVPGAGIASSGHAAEDRGAPAGGEAVPPVTPRQDTARSSTRSEESPQPQKRGLFGFARAGGQENDKTDDRRDTPPASNAPQFPPRSRATPVAPPTPSPYPPRRTSETSQPAADVTAGLAAALAAGGGVAAAAARSGSGDAAAAASVTPQETSKAPLEEVDGSEETARSTPDLQQALLSDMERELEAAFQRQAAPKPVPEAPAQPDAQTPPETPAFPTRMAPTVPEPVMSEPEQADMAADEAPAVADTARLVHPHVPEPGMTPPPSTGPAYFAPVVDEAIPPQEERQEKWQEKWQDALEEEKQGAPEEESRDPGFPGVSAHAPEAGMATTAAADEALVGETAEEEAFGKVIGADEAASAPPAREEPAREETAREEPPFDEASLDEPDVEEPRFAAASAEAPLQDSASEEALQVQSPSAPVAEPAQDVAEEKVEESAEVKAEEAPEASTEEPARTPDEPKSKVDPFSVDEIEAEFARLLGRSVDKDPKSS